jgi:hypothetical protein
VRTGRNFTTFDQNLSVSLPARQYSQEGKQKGAENGAETVQLFVAPSEWWQRQSLTG